MKIFVACSKYFYEKIPPIDSKLKKLGHETMMPNSFNDPFKEERVKELSSEDHIKWKSMMIKKHESCILPNDAILVLNFEKKRQKNYIGGATFLEVFKAWELGKKIFFYNPLPENIFNDELIAFEPIIINGNLKLIK